MTESMIERVARAIQAEMRCQGVLYEWEPGEEDLSRLMMMVGASADLAAVARAALEASGATWQPIETAPKDGSPVDLWRLDQDGHAWRIADARWYTGPGQEGWFDPNASYNEPGEVECEPWTHPETGRVSFRRATHWMRPPEPPKVCQTEIPA